MQYDVFGYDRYELNEPNPQVVLIDLQIRYAKLNNWKQPTFNYYESVSMVNGKLGTILRK